MTAAVRFPFRFFKCLLPFRNREVDQAGSTYNIGIGKPGEFINKRTGILICLFCLNRFKIIPCRSILRLNS